MIKRLFDVIASIIILILLALPALIISLIIIFGMGRPVFFKQIRPGKDCKPFSIVKFRTLNNACDGNGKLLPDEKRMTDLGRILRATSLDEVPEFWNVLKGEMSIVGPRPLLMEYLPLYNDEQLRRHEVRPGVTGWAQINGRNAISWEEKFKLDVWYVDNQSFLLDIKILFLTVLKVFKKVGISEDGQATMSKFTGCEK